VHSHSSSRVVVVAALLPCLSIYSNINVFLLEESAVKLLDNTARLHQDMHQESTTTNDNKMSDARQRICLVGAVAENQSALEAALKFNIPVLTSLTGTEFIADSSWTTYFILDAFEGATYEKINKSTHK